MLMFVLAGQPVLSAACRQLPATVLSYGLTVFPRIIENAKFAKITASTWHAGQLRTFVSSATIRLRATSASLHAVVPDETFRMALHGSFEAPYVSPGTLPVFGLRRLSTGVTEAGSPSSKESLTTAAAITSSFFFGSFNQQLLQPLKPQATHALRRFANRPSPPLRAGHNVSTFLPVSPWHRRSSKTAWHLASQISTPKSCSLHTSPQPAPPSPLRVRRFGTSAAAAAAAADAATAATAATAAADARDPSRIRNFAIIAHIDHGKTTLMDRLLAACGHGSDEDRAMDSHSLERERGITILAKVTSFTWGAYHINAVDTPGHADFGGEVERVLGLVDGCVLLVDAAEGPLAQTKYVVAKALERGLRPIVLLNKVDRPAATPERCAAVANSLLDLFVSLGASDEQLDFPLLYSSAKQGWVSRTLPGGPSGAAEGGMAPLLDTIVAHVPAPASADDVAGPFVMRVAMIERDPYIGRIATGRVATGRVRIGDKVRVLSHEAGCPVGGEARITRITKRAGMSQIPLEEAVAGDIVSVAGPGAATIADSIASPEVSAPLDPGRIDPPTLAMVFGPNDSPLSGRAGKALTGRAIGELLMAEAETSVSLRVVPVAGATERYEVQARGELQLGVLIEGMRRKGAELAVSPPQVLLRHEGGQVLEPLEEVMVEVADDVAGVVIEALSQRRGELTDMTPLPEAGKQRLTFVAPSRGLIGFKSMFVHMTRGEGIMSRVLLKYEPHKGPLGGVRKGVLVSLGEGRATTYALGELQSRGTFFISPGTEVYGGMVVGEHTREDDLDVNPVKEKKTSNVRNTTAEEKVQLAAPRAMTLEDAIGYVAADELIEVTPAAVRIRKEILDAGARRVRAKRQQQQQQQ